jgi:dihydrofolate reductase
MGIVIVDISVSLDGFIAGANVTVKQPLGEAGLRLHEWFFKPQNELEKTTMAGLATSSGAIILGRTMYDTGIDEAWGGVTPFDAPAYVVTSRPAPEKQVDGFYFVNEGIQSALSQAKASAGEKNIWVIGGANLIQQYIKVRLVDELRLHLVPVLFGEGSRLFEHIGAEHRELEKIDVIESPSAIHTRFRFLK